MNFLTVIVRGLLRRPVRTGLTLLGIAIGIAAVVALVGMAGGYEKSVAAGFKARGTDVVVSNVGGGLLPKAFDMHVEDRVAHLPHVAAASNALMQLLSVETEPMMMVSGREWGGYTWGSLRVVAGRLPHDATEPAVVLGRVAADILKKKVGDTVQIETQEFPVVGIVESDAMVESGAIILALEPLQAATGNEGKANFVNIRLTPGTTNEEVQRLCAQIKAVFPAGRATVASEVVSGSQGFRMARAMSWGTSLLAVIVGIFGVMNTMLMTVFERTHEIGILLALGWRRGRIVRMILWESALLGLLGGVAGVGLGALALRLLQHAPAIRGLLEPDANARLLGTAVAIAVVVGVVSGLYPAWRSSRLAPSLALHG